MVERRNSIRVECELFSSFRNLDSENPGRIETAVVKNISRGGIKIRFDNFVPLENRLYIYLPLPSHQTIEAQVVPAWIVELPHLGKYEMGVRFVNIKSEDEAVIEGFQYQALLEKMPFRPHIVKDLIKDPEKNNPNSSAEN